MSATLTHRTDSSSASIGAGLDPSPMRAVRQRATFQAFRGHDAQRFGRRSDPIRVSYLASVDGDRFDDVEIAFAIGRQFGNAVERNRARRRIRNAWRLLDAEHSLPHGAYLFRPNRSVLHCSFDEVSTSLSDLVDSVTSP